jgi:hypothetical protein
MLKRIVALTLLTTFTLNAAFAQNRDYRRERAELARQEKEEKKKMRSERPNIDYGTNIIRISPITAMDLGVGFGLSYEKIFGTDKMVGLVLPAYLLLNDGNNEPFLSSNSNTYDTKTYFYFNPGVKIYPFGQRRVTYAVGPSLLLGYGGGSEWSSYYDPLSGNTISESTDVSKLRMGMLVNNYVNFQITKGFNLGIEVGLGALYIDRETVERPNSLSETINHGIGVTGSFSLTLGYRF